MSIGRKFLMTAAAAGLSAGAFSATAQEAVPSINNGALSFGIGADVVSSYVFRGFELEDSGLILQPYAEVGFAIADGVDMTIGTWNSIHSEHGSTTTTNDEWFESDFYVGIDFSPAELLALSIVYTNYLYPSGAAGDYQEISLTAAFDDSGFLGDNALSPYAMIAFEFATDNAADDDNIYAELGVEWSTELAASEDYPITLSVPVTLGLSIDEFYTDADEDNVFFGFLSIGANASVPLEFIPSKYGTWSAGAGLTLFLLNSEVDGGSPGSALVDSDDEGFNLVGSIGVALEY